MSIGELLIILIVIVLVIKPEDIPILLQKLHSLLGYITKLKQEIFGNFYQEFEILHYEREQNTEELDFYLKKIISIEGQYTGQHTVKALKNHYYQLLRNCNSKDDLTS